MGSFVSEVRCPICGAPVYEQGEGVLCSNLECESNKTYHCKKCSAKMQKIFKKSGAIDKTCPKCECKISKDYDSEIV